MISFTSLVEMKFAGLGGAWTDVSSHVRAESISLEQGIFGRGSQACVADPGALRFTLNTNATGVVGYYAPFHANVRSGFWFNTPVRWTLTESGNSTVQFLGRLGAITVAPGVKGERATLCTAFDPLFNLGRMTFPSGLDIALNKRADELLALVLALDPDYGQLYTGSFGTGVSTFAYAFDSIQDKQTTLREELHRIALSDGGKIYFSAASAALVFAPQDAASDVIDVSFDNTMIELTAPSVIDDQPTRVEVTAYPVIDSSTGAGGAVVLYSLGQTDRLIQPGEVVTFFGPYRDPDNPSDRVGGRNFTAVTATTDYTMNTLQDGTGTNLTASFSVSADEKGNGVYWTIQNNSTSAGYITLLQLRGHTVVRRATTVSAENAYDAYSSRTETFDVPYQNQLAVAQERADYYAHLYAEPTVRRIDTVGFFAGSSAALATAARTLNTGDMIALTETQHGFSGSQFAIHGIRHELRGLKVPALWTTWTLETHEVGRLIDIPFSAGNFTGNGSMTWTVVAGNVLTYAYRLDGAQMFVVFYIVNTTVSGTPNTSLQIAIPAGKTSAMEIVKPCEVRNNGTKAMGRLSVADGGTVIQVQLVAVTNWAASTILTDCYGSVTIEVDL